MKIKNHSGACAIKKTIKFLDNKLHYTYNQ